MSCLISSRGKRRLFLICVRLLVQCVMGWSLQQAGMDEADLSAFKNKTPMSAMSAHEPRAVWLANNGRHPVAIHSLAGPDPDDAHRYLVTRG
jgi:hypothetical protein